MANKICFKTYILLAYSLTLVGIAFAESTQTTTVSTAIVTSVLELSVSQEGQSELRFGHIVSSTLEETQAGPIIIKIDVRSNSGEPYLLTQSINGAMQNAEGDQIGLSHLKFTTKSSNTLGAAISSPTPVGASTQIIFTSDAAGTSDTIEASYTLTVPISQAPGDYSALLTYTVSSL